MYWHLNDCLILIKYTFVYTYLVMKYDTLLFYISHTQKKKKKKKKKKIIYDPPKYKFLALPLPGMDKIILFKIFKESGCFFFLVKLVDWVELFLDLLLVIFVIK